MMNDFTKSEILILHLALIRDMIQFERILKTSPSVLELRDKLESMIDNYDAKVTEAWHCEKCGYMQ